MKAHKERTEEEWKQREKYIDNIEACLDYPRSIPWQDVTTEDLRKIYNILTEVADRLPPIK